MASNPMMIPVETIPAHGLTVTFTEADPEFAELLLALENHGPAATGTATLELTPWPRRLDVQGRIEAQTTLTCSRGLEPYRQPLVGEFTHIFLRDGRAGRPSRRQREDEELGLELESHDLDREPLVGDTVDLASVLNEELQLAVPYKPLCLDECEGPCPNMEATASRPDAIDPRWAALKALKLDR